MFTFTLRCISSFCCPGLILSMHYNYIETFIIKTYIFKYRYVMIDKFKCVRIAGKFAADGLYQPIPIQIIFFGANGQCSFLHID